MRVKEEAEDYRYFREPDLVDLDPDVEWQERVRAGLGVMPAERRAALLAHLSDPSDAQLTRSTSSSTSDSTIWWCAAIVAGVDPALALARAANELAADPGHVADLSSEAFEATLLMEQRGDLSATQAKTVLAELLASGGESARHRERARVRAALVEHARRLPLPI